jgi:two-component system, sensor histidine kinase PdtaS
MSAQDPTTEDVALSLTLAVVTSSPGPLLLLDDQMTVIAASLSFCYAFGGRPEDLMGQALFSLGGAAWDVTQLRAMIAATLFGDAEAGPCEIDFEVGGSTRSLIAQSRRLSYLDLTQTRILVAVSDVTDAKADAAAKEDALRRNRTLLMEARHRVANSLQIIASILLQNARKTDSGETRDQLRDAHQRVMSVAALERLLSASEDGDVEVHAYFTSLCDSIAASMIGDLDHISLTVDGGEAVVEARVSVSLGLIVTELVINALKYAFPDGRHGKITVDYGFHGPNWVLCVSDDGVGMPLAGGAVRAGLGTSIVQALAKQLDASVEVEPEHPGTRVSIRHTQIAVVQDKANMASDPLATGQGPSRAISG